MEKTTPRRNLQRTSVRLPAGMPIAGMSERDAQIVIFVGAYCDRLGICPTQAEIREALGLPECWKGHLSRWVAQLRAVGIIRQAKPDQRRCIALTDLGQQLYRHFAAIASGRRNLPATSGPKQPAAGYTRPRSEPRAH